MSDVKQTDCGLDRTNYPAHMGQKWEEEEEIRLLTSIRKKKTTEEIAKEHERTVGGIISHLRQLAVDYYLNDSRSLDDIQKITGLSKESIEDAIARRKYKDNTIREKKETSQKPVVQRKPKNDMTEVILVLKDIRDKFDILIRKIE